MKPKRALVCIEDGVWRGRLAGWLTRHGLDVAVSASVDDALEQLERQPAGMVLTDRMFEGRPQGQRLLASVLRQELGCRVAVIVERADPAVALDCLRTGAVDVLAHPLDETVIARLVERVAAAPARYDTVAPPHAARVLLLESDSIRCDRYRDILVNHGYRVKVADGGDLVASIEREAPDLAILDGGYAGSATFDRIGELKRREPCRHIPLIVSGPVDDAEGMCGAFRAGADDYLAEPADTTDIVLQVRRLADWKWSHDRLRHAMNASDRKRDELARESWFFKELNRFLELGDKTSFIRQRLAGLLRVERFAIGLLDEAQLELTPLVHNLDEPPGLDAVALHCDEAAHEAARSRGIVSADPFDSGSRCVPWLEGRGARTLTTLPLVVGQRLWGIVHLIDRSAIRPPVDYSETVFRILENLANSLQNSLLYAETKRLAITDGLTGLSNHGAMARHLRFELDRVARYGTMVSLVMFDLDNFKQINDRFGHPQGDMVLAEVASLLRDGARSTDLAARYGGEEFLVVLSDTPKRLAEAFACRIRERIEQHRFDPLDGQSEIHCTASIGVACAPDDAAQFDELLRIVDSRLYQAKRSGKNRVVSQ